MKDICRIQVNRGKCTVEGGCKVQAVSGFALWVIMANTIQDHGWIRIVEVM